MAAAQPTEEEKTLMELQDRMLNGTQAQARLNKQEALHLQRKRAAELTAQELQSLPEETVSYKSVGRAYFLSTKADMLQAVKEEASDAVAELENIRTQRGVVEQKLKETETELRELIQSSPAIVQQLQSLRTA